MDRLPTIDYSRHPAYQREPDLERGRQAADQLALLVEHVTEIEAQRVATFGYRYGAQTEDGRMLLRDGVLQFQLSAPVVEDLSTHAAPAVAAVKARMEALEGRGKAPKFADRMERASREIHAPLHATVERAMREIGAFELTTAFFGARYAKLQNMAVMVSTPRDKESLLLAESPAAGLHVDSSGKCILKAVLYISDVSPDQGPFGMVPGSHMWDPGGVERIHRRAFDQSPFKSRSPNSLSTFIALPKHLQVKAEFGGDLLPEWEETRVLLGSERVALGQRGLVSLFDPEAVHRGGLVTTGERLAILVTMSAVY